MHAVDTSQCRGVKRAHAPTLSADRSHRPSVLSPMEYARRHAESIALRHTPRPHIALIISAYNEELVLEHTIRSAIAAGLDARHIYVVDDGSRDATSRIARRLLGDYNVLRVANGGKGKALHTISSQLLLTRRYRWIHVADADGGFDKRYFRVLRRDLRVRHAAATGYVTSMPGSVIGQYRVYEYAVGMEVIRRFQALAKVITIIPGPTSIFRSDVFERLNFRDGSMCEDFDVTLQLHREGMGTIQFIPEAIANTQDPATFGDFKKQVTRWNRGVMQMLFKHKIGRKVSRVDAYLSYQVFQNLMFFCMYVLMVPFLAITKDEPAYLALAFLSDVILTLSFVVFAAQRASRWDILGAFPIIYGMRWVSLMIFMRAYVEVAILRRHRTSPGNWVTVQRVASPAV